MLRTSLSFNVSITFLSRHRTEDNVHLLERSSLGFRDKAKMIESDPKSIKGDSKETY